MADHELTLTDEASGGDAVAAPDPAPTMIYCKSCDAEYPVSHTVDAPGTPEDGKHF